MIFGTRFIIIEMIETSPDFWEMAQLPEVDPAYDD